MENDNKDLSEKELPKEELPEIVPKEELVFSGKDKLKMIFGGYLAMLPAFVALLLAFLIVYFLILLIT